jgi:hypothetical protein
LLDLVARERGALLWLPALFGSAWLVLFALRVAPMGSSLFTRTTSLRIAVGPWEGDADAARAVAELRQRLGQGGEISLVDSLRVAERLAAVAGDSSPWGATPPDSTLVRALRPLNAHLAVTGRIAREGAGYRGELRAFDARRDRWVLHAAATGALPESVGAALAESLRTAAFAPRPLTASVH